MKHVELLVGLPFMREVGCTLDFGGKVVMQFGQWIKVNAMSEVYLKHISSVFHYDLLLVW